MVKRCAYPGCAAATERPETDGWFTDLTPGWERPPPAGYVIQTASRQRRQVPRPCAIWKPLDLAPRLRPAHALDPASATLEPRSTRVRVLGNALWSAAASAMPTASQVARHGRFATETAVSEACTTASRSEHESRCARRIVRSFR